MDKEYSRNSIWGTELHGADTLQKLERGDEIGARPDRRVLRMSQVHGELVWTEERDQQSSTFGSFCCENREEKVVDRIGLLGAASPLIAWIDPSLLDSPASITHWSTIPANLTMTDGNITGIRCDIAAGDSIVCYAREGRAISIEVMTSSLAAAAVSLLRSSPSLERQLERQRRRWQQQATRRQVRLLSSVLSRLSVSLRLHTPHSTGTRNRRDDGEGHFCIRY